MTGLDLESFLYLLRWDFGAWASLGVVVVCLALMTWTSWGSRRVLRKCLVFSLIVHFGLVLYGSTMPIVRQSNESSDREVLARDRIREIRVTPLGDGVRGSGAGATGSKGSQPIAAFDRPSETVALAERELSAPRPETPEMELVKPATAPADLETPAPNVETPSPPPPEARPVPTEPKDTGTPPAQVRPAEPGEVAAPEVIQGEAPAARGGALGSAGPRLRPDRSSGARRAPQPAERPAARDLGPLTLLPPPRGSAPETRGDGSARDNGAPSGDAPPSVSRAEPSASGVPAAVVNRSTAPPPRMELPEADLRRTARADRGTRVRTPNESGPQRGPTNPAGVALLPVVPEGRPGPLEAIGGPGGRPLTDVPEVYRPRLDPNRSALAQRAGASSASEQAVERALDWLTRHQDADGRWDGATGRLEDGTVKAGDDDFTIHCPPGETCFGPCMYWDADTALTGLALLAYLGAGYTQADGKYAETVGKGIDFLLSEQKADGDLRGPARAVGMYCHAMATIALCEAYALTGEARLRRPVERAIGFLVRSRARDGLAWRYQPGAPHGDTSILGWVVLAFKSAKVVGIEVPATIPRGALGWLDKVADGAHKGLARYRPEKQLPSPTMTAEAWVCRQFLGIGGPGPMSTEASQYLLAHSADKVPFDLYYLYYGTLAMYQHGGDPWDRWNAASRDLIVSRQRATGHSTGSWDPDESEWARYGGRIYCTALATLSLEVYYRFLRLYDDPRLPSQPAPNLTRPSNRPIRRSTFAPSPSRP